MYGAPALFKSGPTSPNTQDRIWSWAGATPMYHPCLCTKTRDIYMNIYMLANQSNQQGVPCLWLALGEASLPSRHGITFVPLREVGRPRPRKHRCHCMLASCLQCIKLTVRDHRPLDMLNLLPAWAAVNTICWSAEKEWFLTGKSRAQTLVKTLPSAYGAGKTTYT